MARVILGYDTQKDSFVYLKCHRVSPGKIQLSNREMLATHILTHTYQHILFD